MEENTVLLVLRNINLGELESSTATFNSEQNEELANCPSIYVHLDTLAACYYHININQSSEKMLSLTHSQCNRI